MSQLSLIIYCKKGHSNIYYYLTDPNQPIILHGRKGDPRRVIQDWLVEQGLPVSENIRRFSVKNESAWLCELGWDQIASIFFSGVWDTRTNIVHSPNYSHRLAVFVQLLMIILLVEGRHRKVWPIRQFFCLDRPHFI